MVSEGGLVGGSVFNIQSNKIGVTGPRDVSKLSDYIASINSRFNIRYPMSSNLLVCENSGISKLNIWEIEIEKTGFFRKIYRSIKTKVSGWMSILFP